LTITLGKGDPAVPLDVSREQLQEHTSRAKATGNCKPKEQNQREDPIYKIQVEKGRRPDPD